MHVEEAEAPEVRKKVVSEELSDGELENVTGGAVDAFIYFSSPGVEVPGDSTEPDFNTKIDWSSFTGGVKQR
jgi:hypothetical protein